MYAGKLAEKAPAATIVESPQHPYTELLLSSLPEVGVRFAEKRLQGIPGRPPSLSTRRPAAASARAARSRSSACKVEPPFVAIEPAHESACWKAAA